MTSNEIRRPFLCFSIATVCLMTLYTIMSSTKLIEHSFHAVNSISKIIGAKERNTVCFNRTVLLEHLSRLKKNLLTVVQAKSLSENVDKIIHMIETCEENEKDTDDSFKTKTLEVCPELWKNKLDHPYFYTGWVIVNCSNVPPIHTILSILLYPLSRDDSSCTKIVSRIASGLKKSYRNVSILVANVKNFCKDLNVTSEVKVIPISDPKPNPGRVWNSLVNEAKTKYVLIGRDLDSFMWMPNLERPVRVVSYENNSVQIVGGAVRNRTGHWRIGCYQSSMGNYILQYQEGYYKSKNECMFCDSLAGPFVARTDLLKKFPFDQSLPVENVFEDFFLTIKQESYSVVNCPDVMYFASDPALDAKSNDRSLWKPLVKKWGLNRVVVPNGRVFAYSCAESGIRCTGLHGYTLSFLIPICCLEQFGRAVAFIDNFCRSRNLPYEYEAGSILGIVKISGLMPWDLDGDLTYLHYNLSVYKNNRIRFKKHRLILTAFEEKSNGSYFKLYTPNMYIEMIGELIMSYDDPRATIFRDTPTQALMHGRWVFTSPSPGLYSRNRYGIEMLRHTHSWLQLGMKGWAPYKSGYFKKCKKPKHHACLDHFSTDGNLQFGVPNRYS